MARALDCFGAETLDNSWHVSCRLASYFRFFVGSRRDGWRLSAFIGLLSVATAIVSYYSSYRLTRPNCIPIVHIVGRWSAPLPAGRSRGDATMTELTKRQRMAAVVRALLAKTSEAGATEAEPRLRARPGARAEAGQALGLTARVGPGCTSTPALSRAAGDAA